MLLSEKSSAVAEDPVDLSGCSKSLSTAPGALEQALSGWDRKSRKPLRCFPFHFIMGGENVKGGSCCFLTLSCYELSPRLLSAWWSGKAARALPKGQSRRLCPLGRALAALEPGHPEILNGEIRGSPGRRRCGPPPDEDGSSKPFGRASTCRAAGTLSGRRAYPQWKPQRIPGIWGASRSGATYA